MNMSASAKGNGAPENFKRGSIEERAERLSKVLDSDAARHVVVSPRTNNTSVTARRHSQLKRGGADPATRRKSDPGFVAEQQRKDDEIKNEWQLN